METPPPPDPIATLWGCHADLDNLTWDCGEAVVDGSLRRNVERLDGAIDALAVKLQAPAPTAAWRELAMLDAEGNLLWRGSLTGAWGAQWPSEAQTWSTEDVFHAWLVKQHPDFLRRLAERKFELVELATEARRLRPLAIPDLPRPAVAEPKTVNGHVLYTAKDCPYCHPANGGEPADNCPLCDGGLGMCSLCHRAEIELDEPCAGRRPLVAEAVCESEAVA